jgi:DNA replication protein DnaC
LKLAQFPSQWQAAEQQAIADGWTPTNYLYVLTEQEHQQRHQARLRRLLHEAQLPVLKTLAEIDWDAIPDLDRHQIEQLGHGTGWLDRGKTCCCSVPAIWARATWQAGSAAA